jgi:alkanesulfonate monooxygenase SsuD/methylene tetrahydromethanopterin reductase-like flavin-dependent oxidoreductase (luciferase family)
MSRAIKFCVRVHQGGYSYDTLRRIWQDADRLGYYSASLYDLLNIPTLECWTTLCALAAETRRVRLIPMVLANPYRPPALLARMAATLDVISRGRLELGIGAGGGRGDHRAYGYPFPSTAVRVAMLEEAVDLIKQLWTRPRVDFAGRYYKLEGATIDPRPAQQPRPPVLIGGHGEKYLLRAVARHADICNIGSELSLAEHRAKLAILAEHCRAAGRDLSQIEVSHNTRVFIAETEAQLGDLLARRAAAAGMSAGDYRASLSGAVVGTPQQCAEQLRPYIDEGISYFFLIFPDPAPTESLELFAREVMPKLAAPENG